MIEWWARSLNEEMFGHWAKRWRQALLDKYHLRIRIFTTFKSTKKRIFMNTKTG